MKTKNLIPTIVDKQDLLSEIDTLMILGGEEKQEPIKASYQLSYCKPEYTNCNGAYCANCVANCGRTVSDSISTGPVRS